ncbi:ABC transporter substrate-binding protein [Claveliimonas bilis]|uniref:ABC transporter substrate-binding protein n=1 Tax=Claveliimonas bilis TaxID=3028070 RepID=UPI00292E2DAB|nr:ABC transporter substrate-binding protein [Claveliimonas bilis]BDZ80162.1 sugar ABC transporter substrate-binding protein [Claveliimonas bilis]
MKKRVLCALLAAAMTASLTVGCGSKEESKSEDGKVHIQFMHQQVEQERQDAVQEIIDAFQEENPDIVVESIPVNEDDYDSKITAQGGNGQLPAIVEYSQDQAKTSVANQFTSVDAVNEVIEAKGEDAFYEGALRVTKTEDGEGYVGVPISSWVQGIWVNEAMLTEKGMEVPTTWEEVLEVAKAFYDPDNRMYGIALPTSDSAFTEQVFSQFAISNGANVFDGEKNVTVNTPEMKEALEYYKELASYSMPGSTEVADVNDAFVAKNAPMAMYSTYILGNVEQAGFAQDLTLVLPNKETEAAYGCITVLGIAEGMSEEETEAAKKFVSFMLEEENNVNWLNMAPGGIQPVLKAVAEMPEYTDLEARQSFIHLDEAIANAVDNLQLFGAVDGKNYTEMGDITNTGTISKMINSVVVQDADIDAELETAQAAVEDLLK